MSEKFVYRIDSDHELLVEPSKMVEGAVLIGIPPSPSIRIEGAGPVTVAAKILEASGVGAPDFMPDPAHDLAETSLEVAVGSVEMALYYLHRAAAIREFYARPQVTDEEAASVYRAMKVSDKDFRSEDEGTPSYVAARLKAAGWSYNPPGDSGAQ